MSIAQDLLADLPDAEVIPLPLIRERVGWNRQQQHNAIELGVIRPIEKRGQKGCYQVTRDDAVMILLAAAIALAAGVAVVTMLRGLQGAGLDVAALAGAVT